MICFVYYTVRYRIASGLHTGDVRFEIDEGGEMFACGFLDRESNDLYTVSVIAEGMNAFASASASATATATVHVCFYFQNCIIVH